MTIKELAHTAQHDIKAATGMPFKRSHIHELLAATLGFRSCAALYADHVMDEGSNHRPMRTTKLQEPESLAHQRAIGIELAPQVARAASGIVAQVVEARGLFVRHLDELVTGLRQDRGLEDWAPVAPRDYDSDDGDDEDNDENVGQASGTPFDESDCSVILLESLQRAGSAGDHRAHYALALLLARDEDGQPEGSAHWHRLQQEGQVLEGVEKERAGAYADSLGREDVAQTHLERAAALGNPHALLDVAEASGDADCFHRAAEAGADPVRLADLALRFDRQNVDSWMTGGAQAGDIRAMRSLVTQFDHQDLQRCWTWVHLARMLGTDLTKDNMRAYHDGGPDDGRPYDDDVGGALYVNGIEGVELEALPSAQDLLAREAAAVLFSRLPIKR